MERKHLGRNRAERRFRNYVIRESGSRYFSARVHGGGARIVNGTGPFSEITLQHPCGGECVSARQLAAADIELVEREEEKRSVLAIVEFWNPNRSPGGKAPFILLAGRLAGGGEAAGVKFIVVVKLEGAAVQRLWATLHCGTGDAGESVRRLSRVGVGEKPEIADS